MFRNDETCRVFGVTPVENLFITRYLPDADGDFVKVYLYCLYLAQSGAEEIGVPGIASTLSMDAPAVERALRYWERRQVLTRVPGKDVEYSVMHLGHRILSGQKSMPVDMDYVAFSEAVYTLFGDRRKVGPSEIAMAYDWVKDMGLQQGTVLMLLTHCIRERGVQFSFKKYAEKLAVELSEQRFYSPEDAESYFATKKKTHDGARQVLRRFGLRRLPTEDELHLYGRWTEEMGFSDEDILSACAEVVKATNPSFGYLNGVLEGLKARGGKESGVTRQLTEENKLLEETRAMLDMLGVRVSPVAVQGVYARWKSQYSSEMILAAAEKVRSRGGRLEDIEAALAAFQKQGLDSVEKLRAARQKYRALLPFARKMLDACGQQGAPTEHDMSQLSIWLKQFSPDLIEYAATLARGAKQKMPYIDKILSVWRKEGVTTLAEAKARPQAPGARPAREVAAHRYNQREYTAQEMNQSFIDLAEE